MDTHGRARAAVRSLGFNEIARGLPGISRSVLSQRLRRLIQLGIVKRDGRPGDRSSHYRLSPAGEHLGESVKHLGAWAAIWVLEEPSQAELDPDLLVLWISRHVDADALPTRRVVVAFDLRGSRPARAWLVLEHGVGVSLCHQDPLLDERDYVHVQADSRTLYRVYMGRTTLRDALDDGSVRITGLSTLVRSFSRWFTWSYFAPIVRTASTGQARRLSVG